MTVRFHNSSPQNLPVGYRQTQSNGKPRDRCCSRSMSLGLCDLIAGHLGKDAVEHLPVLDEVEQPVVGFPALGHVDAEASSKQLDQRRARLKRLGHDDGEYVEQHRFGHAFELPEQPCHAVVAVATAGDGRCLRVEAEHVQKAPPPLVERGFGDARLDTLGDGIAVRPLRLRAHLPQARADDRVSDHDAQRYGRAKRERGSHRRMTVKVDIILQGCGDLRSDRLSGRLAPLQPPRFLAGQITFVELDITALADADEDLAALALRRPLNPKDEFEAPPGGVLHEMVAGGVNLPWNLGLCILIGIWLMFTRVTLGAEGWMANADHLVGALVLTVVSVAAAEVARPVRFLLIPLGLALFATPFVFDGSLNSVIANFICGAALIGLSVPRGPIRQRYGDWNRLLLRLIPISQENLLILLGFVNYIIATQMP